MLVSITCSRIRSFIRRRRLLMKAPSLSLLELLGVDVGVCLLIKLDRRRGSGVANDGSFQF